MIGLAKDAYLDELRKYRNMTLGEVGSNLMGKGGTTPFQAEGAKMTKWAANRIPGVSPSMAAKAGRFAGRAVPLLSVVANVGDVADLVTGDESLGNKAMDGAAMAGGAAIGAFLGAGVLSPLGASVGAATGKMLSDGAQLLFGDKKTPEQRKIEQVLAAQQGRYI